MKWARAFFISLWDDISLLLRFLISGAVIRIIIDLIERLLKWICIEEANNSFIIFVDELALNIVFPVFVLLGIISFSANTITNIIFDAKKNYLKKKTDYLEEEKKSKGKYTPDGLENLPGKTGEIFEQVAEDLENFNPEE